MFLNFHIVFYSLYGILIHYIVNTIYCTIEDTGIYYFLKGIVLQCPHNREFADC